MKTKITSLLTLSFLMVYFASAAGLDPDGDVNTLENDGIITTSSILSSSDLTHIRSLESGGSPKTAPGRGTVSITAAIPIFTFLHDNWPVYPGTHNTFNFFGGEIGVQWYYAHRRSLRLFGGFLGAWNEFGLNHNECDPPFDRPRYSYNPFNPDCEKVYHRRFYIAVRRR